MITRSIDMLLKVMLENQELYHRNCCGGLCGWSRLLHVNMKIDSLEYQTLNYYIHNHRPSKFSSYDAFKHRKSVYYWTPFNIKPRIEWLKQEIKKLEKQANEY